MHASIRLKMIAGLIVPIVLVMAVIFGITAIGIHEQSEGAYRQEAVKELDSAGRSLTGFLDGVERNVEMLAKDPRAQRVDEIRTSYVDAAAPSVGTFPGDVLGAELRGFYSLILKSHPSYVDAYIGTRNGGFVAGSDDPLPAHYDPRQRPWYQVAAGEPDVTRISKAYVSTNGSAMVSVVRAYSGSGGVLGVASMDISLAQMTHMIDEIRLGRNGFVMMLQGDGTVLAQPRDKQANFKNVSDLEDPAYPALFRAKAQGAGDAVLDVDFGGRKYLAVVHTLPGLGWKLAGLVERSEIMAPVYSILFKMGAGFLIGLLVLAAFIWFFVDRTAVRPLKRVAGFLHGVEQGCLDETIEHRRGDEIGKIFTALNHTACTLQRNMQDITAKTEEAEHKAQAAEQAMEEARRAKDEADQATSRGMRQAAERLEGVVREVHQAVERIAKSTAEIHEGAEVQRDRIRNTATAMEEMNATVMEVARNAGEAASQGDEEKKKAMSGADVVNQSVQAINSIQEQASQLRDNMSELDANAQDIGKILGVITDIADQTNLLALNAAIEAARAGEAGRGFAVVADEVRKLAEKTMTATKEVGDSIASIQSVADRNVSAMGKAVDDLTRATELSNTSGEVLEEIVAGTELSAGRIQGIATAAEEQSAASEEISRSIGEIQHITEETADSVAATQDVLAGLEQQAGKLTELVESLKKN